MAHALLLATATAVAAPATADEPDVPLPSAQVADPAAVAADRLAEKIRREDALRALEGRLRDSATTRSRLRDEIGALSTDRAKLTEALLETAGAVRTVEDRLAGIEERLDGLRLREGALRRSLTGRRHVLAHVLAALQRLSGEPAPALLVRPDDVLAALRSAILLGAVLPRLRADADALATDLASLGRLRGEAATERRALTATMETLAAERDRLGLLVLARQSRLSRAELEAGGERIQADRLGREAGTLKELIERLDGEIAAARQAEAAARAAAEAEARRLREQFAAASSREPVRLPPRLAFADAKGALRRPASGAVVREFGTSDAAGTLRGTAIATRPRALVVASAEGTVVFAGPYRSYGRLLIMDVGGGYYLLLAGMERLSVVVGQAVLAGEPVGQMGEEAAPAAALGVVEAEGPVLYVEVRKDGAAVDPSPWWSKSQGERARG